MRLLEKQGFAVYADVINDNLVETYFYKQTITGNNSLEQNINATKGWEETLKLCLFIINASLYFYGCWFPVDTHVSNF